MIFQRSWQNVPFLLIFMVMTMILFGCEGLTKNRAETSSAHIDPALRSRRYPLASGLLFNTVLEAVKSLPRWKIVEQDLEKGEIHAERQTRLFKFVDDVVISVRAAEDGGSGLDVRSSSRVGKGDLGQNARNILEFLKALDAEIEKAGQNEQS